MNGFSTKKKPNQVSKCMKIIHRTITLSVLEFIAPNAQKQAKNLSQPH